MNKKDTSYIRMKYVLWESILAFGAFGIVMPVITEFWKSIGMNQTLIGLSQMISTIIIVLLDIPMGYIADRYNRKLLNIIGDFGLALSFVIYMYASNFWWAILAEILCGIFVAMTNGVDRAFLKYYSDNIDNTGELFKKNSSKLQSYQFISLCIAVISGMIISKYSIKACMGIVAIPFIISGMLSLLIDDIGQKAVSEQKSNIKAMYSNVKHVLKDSKKLWLIIACGVSGQATHAIMWILTPLLIMVGVPVYIVGIGWILNYITPILGSFVARKCMNYKVEHKFIIPFLLICFNSIILIINPNIFTVWLFGLNGFASGFHNVLLLPIIQRDTEDKYQTTVISIISTISRLIYIPLVYIVNMAANNRLQKGLGTNLLIFIPVYILIYFKLNKLYSKEKIKEL